MISRLEGAGPVSGTGSADVAEEWTLRQMVTGWLATTLVASLGEAVASALRPPWTDVHVTALRTLLLLAPLLLVATSMVLLQPLRNRLGATGSHLSARRVVLGVMLLSGWAVALWVTEFESSVSLRSPRGLALLALFGGGATVVALGAALLANRSPLVHRIGPLRLGAGAALILAAGCFAVGRNVELAPFWPLRFANLFLEAALALAAAALLRRAGLIGRRTALAAVVVLAAAVLVAVTAPPAVAHRAYARILMDGGSERRVLLRLRLLFDFDHNGFSAWFDGGDCDDQNPQARPLGPVDCDHILHRGEKPSAPPSFVDIPQVSRVLVITIDTWRCELLGEALCPRLDELARSASYVGKQRPYMAQTMRSLGVLFGAPFNLPDARVEFEPSPTIVAARAAGYRTKAFYSLNMFSQPSLGGGFDERDTSLVARAINESVVSGALTARVLADLRSHAADPSRRLLWAHYLDPHATYVPTDEGEPVPLLLFDRRGAYKAEVRRVEARVADLVSQALQLGYDKDAAIVVTSDHGESFSHGRLYHSLSSFDTEMRIPIFVWVHDAAGRRVPVPLPPRTQERDVAALLAHLVGAPAPRGQSALSVTDPMDGDLQYLIVDEGWKLVYHLNGHYDEVYHVAEDPEEQYELSEQEPEQLERLRRRLGAELLPLYPED